MADELLRRRRQTTCDIERKLKSENKNYTARDVEQVRLKLANESLGNRETWTKFVNVVESNDLSASQQSHLKREITTTKVELKKTIDDSGEQQIARKPGKGKYPVLLVAENDDLPKNLQDANGDIPLAKRAQINYQRRAQQQRQVAEDNKTFNRYISHHIHGTTPESQLQNETFNEMCDSTVDGRIESQTEYLRVGHEKLYNSPEYQTIIARRKHIALCSTSGGSLNEVEQRRICDLIDDNKKI